MSKRGVEGVERGRGEGGGECLPFGTVSRRREGGMDRWMGGWIHGYIYGGMDGMMERGRGEGVGGSAYRVVQRVGELFVRDQRNAELASDGGVRVCV